MAFKITRTEFKKSDIELDNISKLLSFYAVNPINVDSEYEKFMKDNSYNPEFHYPEYKNDLAVIRERIDDVKTDKSVLGRILEDIKKDYILKTFMLEYRGNSRLFTDYSRSIYGHPDEKLISAAKKLVMVRPVPEKEIYTSKQLIRKFRFAFLRYGFPWKVREKKMVAKAAVNLVKKEILIKKDSNFSERFIQRLIVHEIGTHVTRAENGEMQPYLFLKRGLPGYLMTEEGLAVINEELSNCLNKGILKIYAGRVLAINKALKSSFSETFGYLKTYFSDKTAWKLTVRAKRGLGDTALHGACTKDINYLKGYIKLKSFIKNGGNINKLYYGKIGIQHIGVIKNIPGLIDPSILPIFRHVNYVSEHISKVIRMIAQIS